MGKKNKKTSNKKQLGSFVTDNKVLLAALGGVAAGITLANILGTEKAQEILNTVENSISSFGEKVAKDLAGQNVHEPEQRREAIS